MPSRIFAQAGGRRWLVLDRPQGLKLVPPSTDFDVMDKMKTVSDNAIAPSRIQGPQNSRSDRALGAAVASLAVRHDGTCVLWLDGIEREITWGMARELVDTTFKGVTWTELSDGVWVARTFE